MRVIVREVIDLDYDVELKELTPWERIICAIRKEFRRSKIYKAMQDRRIEQATRESAKLVEDLKIVLLYYINNRLIKNKVMKKRGEHAEYIVIAINRQFKNAINSLIKNKGLVSFDIVEIKPTHDMLLSFPNLPILIMVSKKTLNISEGDNNEK